MQTRRNETIDIVRIIASFFVILCHITLPPPFTEYAVALARFAVPFFFMVSGMYIIKDTEEKTRASVIKALKATVRLTVISSVFIACINTLVCVINDKPMFEWFTGYWKGSAVFSFLICNRARFLSSVMWYLFGYIYTLAAYLLLLRFKLLKKAYYLIVPLLALNLIAAQMVGGKWYYVGNWLFTGIPFVLLGSFLSEHRDMLSKISAVRAWGLIIGGGVLTCIEEYVTDVQIIAVGTLPAVLGIFALIEIYRSKTYPSLISWFGQKCTMYVFILHCTLRDLIYTIAGTPRGAAEYIMPIVFFLLSGIIGVMIVLIKEKLLRRTA